MAVYDKNGLQLAAVYDKDGTSLSRAYDKDGDVIFQSGGPNTITVMTYNVGHFYSEWHDAPTSTGDVFYNRNRAIFDQYHPVDFAGLSEWSNVIGTVQASVLMDEFFASYYPDYTPYPGNPNTALTSAFSVTPSSVSLVSYTAQGSETRYYQKSYATFAGKNVCCILTHLDLQSSARNAQFLEVLSAVQNEEYFIITGDFNFQITQAGDSEYNNSVQIALNNNYNSAQNADSLLMTWYSGETVAESANIYALDNIITSSNIDISNVRVDTTKLTDGLCTQYGIIIDHLPLIADLTIN